MHIFVFPFHDISSHVSHAIQFASERFNKCSFQFKPSQLIDLSRSSHLIFFISCHLMCVEIHFNSFQFHFISCQLTIHVIHPSIQSFSSFVHSNNSCLFYLISSPVMWLLCHFSTFHCRCIHSFIHYSVHAFMSFIHSII